jgi:hypothetical protein
MIVFTIGVFCNPLGEVVGGWEDVTGALEHYFVSGVFGLFYWLNRIMIGYMF